MQFNQDNHRGNTIIKLRMRELYDVIRERLEYVRPNSDLDAVTQNICVEVEKAMGIFPNLPYRAGESGEHVELHRPDPRTPYFVATGKPGEPWKPEVTNRFDELLPRGKGDK